MIKDVIVEFYCEKLLLGFVKVCNYVVLVGVLVMGILGSGLILFSVCKE